MKIDGNEIEKKAMEAFHAGNRAEGLRIQEEFASLFREEYKEKDHCPCKKPAGTTATARSAWPYTGPTGNTSQIACGPC